MSDLSLPAEIIWERVCVTRDMLHGDICGAAPPPRWHSSIALFRHVVKPNEGAECGDAVTYFKVTITITGFQLPENEIRGGLDWNALDVSAQIPIEELIQKLNTYKPCNGAIVQVSVGPRNKGRPVTEWPYFADFEPKQRALYEASTRSGEVVSRNAESVNVRKGGSRAESTETLDVDKGFTFGMEAQVMGSGGGFNIGRSGEWGTKKLHQESRDTVRTTDAGREARETLSYTSQITHMWNLLQSYHLGTNRALFMLMPRPHVARDGQENPDDPSAGVQELSTFVRGPRPLDGVQEFFLIVRHHPDDEPCLAVRVETAHRGREERLDYDRSREPQTASATVTVEPPTTDDYDRSSLDPSGDYDVLERSDYGVATISAPAGYVIERWEEVAPLTGNGTQVVSVTPDAKTLTIRVEATAQCWLLNVQGRKNKAWLTVRLAELGVELGIAMGLLPWSAGWVANIKNAIAHYSMQLALLVETKNSNSGTATYEVRAFFRSETQRLFEGDKEVLIIASRALCCCDPKPDEPTDRFISALDLTPRLLGRGLRPTRWRGDLMPARDANGVAAAVAEVLRHAAAAELPSLARSREEMSDYAFRRLVAQLARYPSMMAKLQARRPLLETPAPIQNHLRRTYSQVAEHVATLPDSQRDVLASGALNVERVETSVEGLLQLDPPSGERTNWRTAILEMLGLPRRVEEPERIDDDQGP